MDRSWTLAGSRDDRQRVQRRTVDVSPTRRFTGRVRTNDCHYFAHTDLCDSVGLGKVFDEGSPAGASQLATVSHVDRSIDGDADFIYHDGESVTVTPIARSEFPFVAPRPNWLLIEPSTLYTTLCPQSPTWREQFVRCSEDGGLLE